MQSKLILKTPVGSELSFVQLQFKTSIFFNFHWILKVWFCFQNFYFNFQRTKIPTSMTKKTTTRNRRPKAAAIWRLKIPNLRPKAAAAATWRLNKPKKNRRNRLRGRRQRLRVGSEKAEGWRNNGLEFLWIIENFKLDWNILRWLEFNLNTQNIFKTHMKNSKKNYSFGYWKLGCNRKEIINSKLIITISRSL